MEKKVDSSIKDSHSNFFIDSIIKNFSLLPQFHINLISLLSSYGWSHNQIFDFFVNSFVIPQVRTLMKAAQFSGHLNLFQEMAERSVQLSKSEKLEKLFKVNSIIEVPHAFSDFDRHFLRFITTTRDASMLFDIAKKVISLPNLLLRLGENESFEELKFRPILLKLYPKNMISNTFSQGWRNVVFPETKIKAQEYCIPVFERRWRFIELEAANSKTSIQDFIKTHDSMFTQSKTEIAYDLSGLCPQCQMKVELEGNGCELCKKCKDLFKNLTPIKFSDYLISKMHSMITGQARNFERMLKLKFSLTALKKWISSADMLYDTTVLALSQQYINTFLKEKKGLPNDYDPSAELAQTADLLNNPKVIQLFHATRAAEALNRWLTPDISRQVERLQSMWRVTMDSIDTVELPAVFRGEGIMKSKRQLIMQAFHSISMSLESLSLIHFSKRFNYLIQARADIEELAVTVGVSAEGITMYALKICCCNELVLTFVSLAGTLAANVSFLRYLCPREYAQWLGINRAFGKLIEYDQELKKGCLNIQKMIDSFVNQVCL